MREWLIGRSLDGLDELKCSKLDRFALLQFAWFGPNAIFSSPASRSSPSPQLRSENPTELIPNKSPTEAQVVLFVTLHVFRN